jgi:hypothetical protein
MPGRFLAVFSLTPLLGAFSVNTETTSARYKLPSEQGCFVVAQSEHVTRLCRKHCHVAYSHCRDAGAPHCHEKYSACLNSC